jgi:hypothetical protein
MASVKRVPTEADACRACCSARLPH